MTPRQLIVNQVIEEKQPAWKQSVFAKLLFRRTRRILYYWKVSELVAFCDALSVLYVAFMEKLTHYFDLSKRF